MTAIRRPVRFPILPCSCCWLAVTGSQHGTSSAMATKSSRDRRRGERIGCGCPGQQALSRVSRANPGSHRAVRGEEGQLDHPDWRHTSGRLTDGGASGAPVLHLPWGTSCRDPARRALAYHLAEPARSQGADGWSQHSYGSLGQRPASHAPRDGYGQGSWASCAARCNHVQPLQIIDRPGQVLVARDLVVPRVCRIPTQRLKRRRNRRFRDRPRLRAPEAREASKETWRRWSVHLG
jgi:hypothetical protein